MDKPYAKKIGLVTRHWSGKHRRVVQGINLQTLLWTDGDRHIPCDYRIYDKAKDGLTNNDHFQQVLEKAHKRGLQPHCIVFDSWYASQPNFKKIRAFQWTWLTRLKENRPVNRDRQGVVAISQIEISEEGGIVHLPGYGLIRVFKIVATEGDIEYWDTNDLGMSELRRIKYASYGWTTENYHQGIKQYCNVERSQIRAGRAQRSHIELALRAFLRLEIHCYHKGISWFETKTSIITEAVRAYLTKPLYSLNPTA